MQQLIQRQTGRVYDIVEVVQDPISGRVTSLIARHKQDRLVIDLSTLKHYEIFKRLFQLKGVEIRGN